MLVPQIFISIFTSDADLASYTIWALRIYMAASLLFAIQLACQQTFIALGNAKTSVFLALLRKVLLLIPLIFILPHFVSNPVFGVFVAEPVADTIAVATTAALFSGSIRNWDNSFNHPLIENIVVKKAKGKETKSFVRLVLPVPNDFASFLFLFINLLMLYWFPHSAIVSTLPPQPEAALSHSKPDSPAPFQREDAAFFQAPVPAGCLPESGLFRLPPEF